MKKTVHTPIILSIAICFALFAGLIMYLYQDSINVGYTVGFIAFLIFILMTFFLRKMWQNRRDLLAGQPVKDEFTRMLELRASYYAFRFSLSLWFALFVFHGQFSDVEDLLGIGLLGSMAIYGIILLYQRRTGRIDG